MDNKVEWEWECSANFCSSDTFVLLLSFETDINISSLFAIVGSRLRLDPPS